MSQGDITWQAHVMHVMDGNEIGLCFTLLLHLFGMEERAL